MRELNGHRLQAVVVNLAVPGVDLPAMVRKVRQRAGEAPIVAVPSGGEEIALPAALDVSLLQQPVDWGAVRALIEAPRGEVVQTESPATSFLRDEACRLERGNRFESRGDDGTPVHGKVLRMSRHFVVTELSDPSRMLAPGWSTPDARIILDGVVSYAGPARIVKTLDAGRALVCEWALQGGEMREPVAAPAGGVVASALQPALGRLRLLGRINEVFKAVVTDVAAVLDEVKQCLDRLEPALDTVPEVLRAQVHATFDEVFSRFESAALAVPDELAAEHHMLVRQQLHPLMLCAPFIHRIYAKPLGFAGDYGTLEMLLSDGEAGHSLYARLLNSWLVRTLAGEAYRARVALVTQHLEREALRCHREGRGLRSLSIGCGAAPEFARFLAAGDMAGAAEMTFVDFNDETLRHAESAARAAMQACWRPAQPVFVRKSIQRLIHDAGRMTSSARDRYGEVARAGRYDVIYCTGLFDYFSARVCSRLMRVFFQMLAPGGSVLVCNFTPANPIRGLMKLILDWDLIHRTENDLISLLPEEVRLASKAVMKSPGGVEAYLACSIS